MGGFFGVVSKSDCVNDLFFGTDYHSHLGTVRGGMAVWDSKGFTRHIHDITNAQFRSKFEGDVARMRGNLGIGVITNTAKLTEKAFRRRYTHFTELRGGEISPTELAATLVNEGGTFEDGLRIAQESIEGSCSILLLTEKGVYAARDRLGRTPIILGEKKGAVAVTMETTAFPNLDYVTARYLGPGEIVRITPDGWKTVKKPFSRLQICTFLWVYYGYPSSDYEGINVEDVRNRCGAALASRDNVKVDMVAGIPDSGTSHAIGYANAAGIPHRRPFVKYTPTWPRSFMPQDQSVRDLVARMKLVPVRSLIENQRVLFCEDSIVRGTQLKDIVQRLYDFGAKEVHMRPACPPLIHGCKFLSFSRSASVLDLAGRRAIKEIEGTDKKHLKEYADPDSKKYCAMVDCIRKKLKLTTLRYQRLDDLVKSVGLPKEKLCTYCWDGAE